jgi:hypothetical protein
MNIKRRTLNFLRHIPLRRSRLVARLLKKSLLVQMPTQTTALLTTDICVVGQFLHVRVAVTPQGVTCHYDARLYL